MLSYPDSFTVLYLENKNRAAFLINDSHVQRRERRKAWLGSTNIKFISLTLLA